MSDPFCETNARRQKHLREAYNCINSIPYLNHSILINYSKHLHMTISVRQGQVTISHPFPHQLDVSIRIASTISWTFNHESILGVLVISSPQNQFIKCDIHGGCTSGMVYITYSNFVVIASKCFLATVARNSIMTTMHGKSMMVHWS